MKANLHLLQEGEDLGQIGLMHQIRLERAIIHAVSSNSSRKVRESLHWMNIAWCTIVRLITDGPTALVHASATDLATTHSPSFTRAMYRAANPLT